ncbi:MAG: peroxide stress protein YaaA [Flavobacteriaceae bacterium]
MKILLSPAKSLDFETPLRTNYRTEPIFSKETAEIQKVLKKKSVRDLEQLMSLSNALATLNFERNQHLEANPSEEETRPALFAFDGDVYKGLDALTLNGNQLESAKDRIRILSGLYGILRPFDSIQPYRLEMGTKMEVADAKSLYGHWRKNLTSYLENELSNNEIIVNLASREYSKAIDLKTFSGRVIHPEFKDYKNGKLKIISFYAKRMRGVMARFLLETPDNDLSVFEHFESDGYRFDTSQTTDPLQPVYTR